MSVSGRFPASGRISQQCRECVTGIFSCICDEKKPPGQYRLLLIVPYEVVSLFSPPAAKNAANIRG